jgi:amidase
VITTDFPLVSNYEGDRPGCPTVKTRGLIPAAFLAVETTDLSVWAWDDFLRTNADPNLNRLSQVDGTRIAPAPQGSLPDRFTGFSDDIALYPARARAHPPGALHDIAYLQAGLAGLERTRRLDLEDWMDALNLDAVIFPAVADVAPADADTNPASADLAWRNGTWVANGNLVLRHFGVPTVTLPMGLMPDTGLPAALTLAGRAHDDAALLALACAFEATGPYRQPPTRTPPLPD